MNTEEKNEKKIAEEKYLADRVDNQIDWYDNKSVKYKKYATRLTIATFISTAFIPFISGLGFFIPPDNWLPLIIGILGLNSTICTGILEMKKFRELWISYRQTCEKLKHEKNLYETKTGKYCDDLTKFNIFVENIEAILISEHSDWSKNIVNNLQEKK